MKKRDPATAPGIGDRVQYLIIKGKIGSKLYQNAEDPMEVLEKNIPIDFNYYLERQLKKPLTRIFKLIIPNPESLFQGEHTKNQFQAKISKNSALGKFFKAKKTSLGCRATIRTGAICKRCRENGKGIEVILEKRFKLNQL